jgi:hypothetical protein
VWIPFSQPPVRTLPSSAPGSRKLCVLVWAACRSKCGKCTDEASDAVACLLEADVVNCPIDCNKKKKKKLGAGAVVGIVVAMPWQVEIQEADVRFFAFMICTTPSLIKKKQAPAQQ